MSCDYCNGIDSYRRKPLFEGDGDDMAQMESYGGRHFIVVETYVPDSMGGTVGRSTWIPIRHCPMCGEAL